jgi:hypothetical protein
MLKHIIEHKITTCIGAIAGICTLAAPLAISGSVDHDSIYLAILLAGTGAILKDPGKI